MVKENEYISQPLQPRDNSTIIFIFSNMNENITQFVKVLLIKLSDMLDSSNFVRLFYHQSFVLYSIGSYLSTKFGVFPCKFKGDMYDNLKHVLTLCYHTYLLVQNDLLLH